MSNVNQVDKTFKSTKNNQNKRNKNTHLLRKRNPPKSNRAENAIYVTTKTGIKVLWKKCENYFNSNVNEFYIYSIGRAIERALNLALQLTEKYPCEIEINTSTVTLTDDLEPLTDDFDFEVQSRNNSMLHIRVLRTNQSGATVAVDK